MPKQLSLSERIVIEKMLVHGYSFAAIARQLDRSASTIAREVKNYRHFVKPISYRNSIDCIHYQDLGCEAVRLEFSNSYNHSDLCLNFRKVY